MDNSDERTDNCREYPVPPFETPSFFAKLAALTTNCLNIEHNMLSTKLGTLYSHTSSWCSEKSVGLIHAVQCTHEVIKLKKAEMDPSLVDIRITFVYSLL